MTGVQKPDDIGQWLAAAQGGDAAAYRRALAAIAPPVRRYAARVLARAGAAQQAEDVVQEVLIAVHVKLHTYRAGENAMPWIYGIARYKAADMLRRMRVRKVSLDDPSFGMEIGDDAGMEAAQAQLDLDRLLALLPPPQGEMVRALKVEGQSVETLAATYGMSAANVKVTVHRALRKLAAMTMRGKKERDGTT